MASLMYMTFLISDVSERKFLAFEPFLVPEKVIIYMKK